MSNATAAIVFLAFGAGILPARFLVPVLAGAVIGGLYESLAAGILPLGHSALNFTNTLAGAVVSFLLASLTKNF